MKKNRNRQTLLLIVAAYLSVISVSPVYAADIQPISAEHVQPAAGAGENSPVIRHTPVEKGEKGEDLLFTAKTDADTVILYYKQNEELPFRAVPMEIVPGKRKATLPKLTAEHSLPTRLFIILKPGMAIILPKRRCTPSI
ncbi:hypothetical protein QKW52_12580 [Bacillus sonorensis]|nr:hypothetical protein [Bacillus sonorensis]